MRYSHERLPGGGEGRQKTEQSEAEIQELAQKRAALLRLAQEVGQAASPYQEDFVRYSNGRVVQRGWLVRSVKEYCEPPIDESPLTAEYYALSAQEIITDDGHILECVQKIPVTKEQWQYGGAIPNPTSDFRRVDIGKLGTEQLDDQWTSLRDFARRHELMPDDE